MKLLELFAGSRSIGKEAEQQGYEVFSIDINNFKDIDLVIDILELKKEMIPFTPDVIWAYHLAHIFRWHQLGYIGSKIINPKQKKHCLEWKY